MKDSIAAFPFTSFLSFYHQLRSRSMTWTTTDTFQTESCSRFSSSWSAAISRTRSYNRFVYIRFTTQTYIRCDDLSPPPPPRPPPPRPHFLFFWCMHLALQIVDKTIIYADKDHDGRVSFEEFCAVGLLAILVCLSFSFLPFCFSAFFYYKKYLIITYAHHVCLCYLGGWAIGCG